MTAEKKKVLMVLTNVDHMGDTGKQTGWYLPEVAHPYEVFEKNGYHVDFLTPLGGFAPVDENSVKDWSKDEVCSRFFNDDKIKEKLKNTLRPEDVKLADYGVIFYAGGHGPLWDIPDNQQIAKLASDLYQNQNGIVSAVCHGPGGILNIKLGNGDYLVKGKKVTGFSNEEEKIVQLQDVVPFLLEDELKNRGAQYEKGFGFGCELIE